MKRKADKLTDDELKVAIHLYVGCGIPLDQLPFSDEFAVIHRSFESRICRPIARANLWHELSNARKAGKLPALIRKPQPTEAT